MYKYIYLYIYIYSLYVLAVYLYSKIFIDACIQQKRTPLNPIPSQVGLRVSDFSMDSNPLKLAVFHASVFPNEFSYPMRAGATKKIHPNKNPFPKTETKLSSNLYTLQWTNIYPCRKWHFWVDDVPFSQGGDMLVSWRVFCWILGCQRSTTSSVDIHAKDFS